MKGDFSRQTFDPTRHFTTVRMQQGRVQLDADWNEQADLALHRVETEAADVIGGCGGPLDAAAFGIVLDLNDLDAAEQAWVGALEPAYTLTAGDFVLAPGRYYVDGILCESEHAVPYTRQPDFPGLAPIDVKNAGFTIVYLDVWQRHLTCLDDPRLRETALGGPDTATRTKTVWQVRTVFAGTGPITCNDNPTDYLAQIAAGTGLLSARAKREDASPDPCLVPASAGFRGLENQLYRVEIHEPGNAYDVAAAPGDQAITIAAADQVVYGAGSWSVGQSVEIFRSAGSDPMEGWLARIVARDTSTKTLTLNTPLPDLTSGDAPRIRPVDATYKGSRDNGSIVSRVSSVTGREVVVASLRPGDFRQGQWVELVDEVTELEGKPGFLVEIEDIDTAGRTITLRVDPPAFTGSVLKLRRWDGVGAVKTHPPGSAEPFVELEDGVQVSFSDGTYKTGDYWLIPARTATADERSGTIEWPSEDDQPLALPPAGIRHHYCKLAILESNGSALTLKSDCRTLFPPLTQLATLVYVGGDGQEALPGQPVPQLLEAGVFRGRRAVPGATVRFTADTGGKLAADLGSVAGGSATFSATTGADGIAACAWLPANDLTRPSQQVEARLLDAGGNPLEPQLDFSAELSIAAEVAYVPGACADLSSATTVQEALDILCKRPTGGSCCRVVEPGVPLDELLEELVKQGERDICLCLKSGEYRAENVELSGDGVSTLVIEACGRGVRIDVGRFGLFSFDAVQLRGLDIDLRGEQPLVFKECADLAIDDCRISRVDAPGLVCVVDEAHRLRIADSALVGRVGVDDAHLDDVRSLIALPRSIEFMRKSAELSQGLAENADLRGELAGRISRARRTQRLSDNEQGAYQLLVTALSGEEVTPSLIEAAFDRLRVAATFAFGDPVLALLDVGAEAMIETSQIVGALVLGGSDAPGKLPTDSDLKKCRAAQRAGRLGLGGRGSLHVRDVQVSRITFDSETGKLLDALAGDKPVRIPVFRATHVVDSEVLAPGSFLIAEDATLNGVDFVVQSADVGGLIGETAIVAGTRAKNDVRLFVVADVVATAANARLNVVSL
jgi:hypothetical protein